VSQWLLLRGGKFFAAYEKSDAEAGEEESVGGRRHREDRLEFVVPEEVLFVFWYPAFDNYELGVLLCMLVSFSFYWERIWKGERGRRALTTSNS